MRIFNPICRPSPRYLGALFLAFYVADPGLLRAEDTAAQAEDTAAQSAVETAQTEDTAAQTEDTAAQTEDTPAQAEGRAAMANTSPKNQPAAASSKDAKATTPLEKEESKSSSVPKSHKDLYILSFENILSAGYALYQSQEIYRGSASGSPEEQEYWLAFTGGPFVSMTPTLPRLALDYLPANHLSVGLSSYFNYDFERSLVQLGIGFRFGTPIDFADHFRFWPKIGLSYNTANAMSNTANGTGRWNAQNLAFTAELSVGWEFAGQIWWNLALQLALSNLGKETTSTSPDFARDFDLHTIRLSTGISFDL